MVKLTKGEGVQWAEHCLKIRILGSVGFSIKRFPTKNDFGEYDLFFVDCL
jgi:hypothetical protein